MTKANPASADKKDLKDIIGGDAPRWQKPARVEKKAGEAPAEEKPVAAKKPAVAVKKPQPEETPVAAKKPTARPARPARPEKELPAEEKAETAPTSAVSAGKKKAASGGPTKDPATFTFMNVTDKMHQVLPDSGRVVIGKKNDAREGSERHAAIAAAQSCKTGADLKKIASNWVNWIKKNGYISFE